MTYEPPRVKSKPFSGVASLRSTAFKRETDVTLNIGDSLLFKSSGSTDDHFHEGIVHRLSTEEVKLQFGEQFNLSRLGDRFDIQLVLNRMPLRRAHFAVTMNNPLDRILFPIPSNLPDVEETGNDQGSLPSNINLQTSQNLEQLRLIMKVLARPPGSPALILFGP